MSEYITKLPVAGTMDRYYKLLRKHQELLTRAQDVQCHMRNGVQPYFLSYLAAIKDNISKMECIFTWQDMGYALQHRNSPCYCCIFSRCHITIYGKNTNNPQPYSFSDSCINQTSVLHSGCFKGFVKSYFESFISSALRTDGQCR